MVCDSSDFVICLAASNVILSISVYTLFTIISLFLLKCVDHQVTFMDISSMNIETFIMLVEKSNYPPLRDKDEANLRKDITIIVDTYFSKTNLTEEKRTQMIVTFEMVAKFIALHVSYEISCTKSRFSKQFDRYSNSYSSE